MRPINFEPLKQIYEIQFDGQVFDLNHPLNSFNKYPAVDKAVMFGLVIITLLSIFILGPAGLLLVLGIPVYMASKRLKNQKQKIWRLFAQVNGWQIDSAEVAESLVPPSLKTQGHSFDESEVISGIYGRVPFSLFCHSFKVGEGRGSQTFTDTVMALKWPAELPRLFLKSIESKTIGQDKSLEEKLKLEGDFDKYFKVYGLPGSEVDELEILAPDMMQFLITNGRNYNLDLDSNTVFLIVGSDARSYSDMPPVFNFASQLYAQLVKDLPAVNQSETIESATEKAYT